MKSFIISLWLPLLIGLFATACPPPVRADANPNIEFYRALMTSRNGPKYYIPPKHEEAGGGGLFSLVRSRWVTIGLLCIALLSFSAGNKKVAAVSLGVALVFFTLNNWMYVFFAVLLFSLYVVLTMEEGEFQKRNPFRKLFGAGRRRKKKKRTVGNGNDGEEIEELEDKVAELEAELDEMQATTRTESDGRKSFNPFAA